MRLAGSSEDFPDEPGFVIVCFGSMWEAELHRTSVPTCPGTSGKMAAGFNGLTFTVISAFPNFVTFEGKRKRFLLCTRLTYFLTI